MKNTDTPWTQEDDEFALTNDRQMTRKAIGEKLGRTKNAVTARLRLLAMTEEEKRAFNTYKWLLRKPSDPRDPPIYRPTPEMLADRARREAMPYRDLTSVLCGDPRVGESALDVRTGSAS